MEWNEKMIELRGEKPVEKAAEEIMVSPDTYMAYERGDRMPNDTVKALIAENLGVEPTDIW